jgi:hypothetical protein
VTVASADLKVVPCEEGTRALLLLINMKVGAELSRHLGTGWWHTHNQAIFTM